MTDAHLHPKGECHMCDLYYASRRSMWRGIAVAGFLAVVIVVALALGGRS